MDSHFHSLRYGGAVYAIRINELTALLEEVAEEERERVLTLMEDVATSA